MRGFRVLSCAGGSRRSARWAWLAVVAAAIGAAALAVPAFGHQSAHHQAAAERAGARKDSSGLANLSVKKATMSCAALANTTHTINGLSVQITQYQVGHAAAGDPEYCAVTGHIAKYIGFEVLLPTKTWRQRYLQIGCGGLCGNIGLDPPQSAGFGALADGDFVVASQDEGHSGNANDWYSNPTQRVDFAYLSDHDLALVSRGLAKRFYGAKPRYSYFDGCSQGGHQALTEAQRYPQDFNGILAGAPATIMTELNSVLHEYETDVEIDSSGHGIVTEPQAMMIEKAALKACDPKVGLMLDYRACERRFKLSSVQCTATRTANCLTPAQTAVMRKIYAGPVDPQGEHLYPGGYPLGSEWGMNTPTSVLLPQTTSQTVTPAAFIDAWLQYFAFEKDIGTQGVANEPFTRAYFEKLQKLAPFWDDTNPYLGPFQKAGGKLILWQGEADWSIPSISSIAYYQAVVKAMGSVGAQRFSRFYLLPSVGHCGTGAPDTYPGLADVVRWTETGKAPGAVQANEYRSSLPNSGGSSGPPAGGGGASSDLTDAIPVLGARPSGPVLRSIKLFPYPELPAYTGHGSVKKASSFVGKVSAALRKPTPWLGTMDNIMTWCNAKGLRCRKRAMPTS